MSHERYFNNHLKDCHPGGDFLSQQRQVISEIFRRIVSEFPPRPRRADPTVYVGLAGVAYAFLHVAQNPSFLHDKDQLLYTATQYVEAALSALPVGRGPTDFQSYLLGDLGVYTVAALIYGAQSNRTKVDVMMSLARTAIKTSLGEHSCNELFVGRAGCVSSALILNHHLGPLVPEEEIAPILECIIESGRRYSREHHHPCSLMYSYYDTEYLGAGHGLVSILLVLLHFPRLINERGWLRDTQMALQYLLHEAKPSGNLPVVSSLLEEPNVNLVHWCHGAPGFVHLLAKAYAVFQDPTYLQAALTCGEVVWKMGLLRKGPGICHGVAGSGYVFLTLYRMTGGDQRHLHRAMQFASFMQTAEFTTNARTPDNPMSLYEGLAGTACFLADLFQPLQAQFPLFPNL